MFSHYGYIFVLVSVLQRNRNSRTNNQLTQLGRLRSRNLCPLQCGEPGKSEGVRTRSANAQGQEEMDDPAQAESAFPFLCLFALCEASMDWMRGVSHW